jgi:hypothetical protein
MGKIKLWFIYEPVTTKGKLSELTKTVINLVKKLEESFDKDGFDLRSIDYSRFLSESKMKINKNELPIVIINDKVVFTKKLPSIDELKQKITSLRKMEKQDE